MSSKSPPTLERAESEKVLDALKLNASTAKKTLKAVRNYCMALLMLDAGLRVGELVALRMQDLYFNSLPVNTIFIKPHQTKNKVAHEIPVSSRLAESLRAYFSAWFLCDQVNKLAFAFYSGSEDRPITTRQVGRIICAAGWKALGRPIHPHVLRHTAGSTWMRVTNTSTVQQMLGHKFLSSTQVYCHPNAEDKRRAIDSASHPLENHQPAEQLQQDQSQPDEHQAPKPVPASPLSSQPASHW